MSFRNQIVSVAALCTSSTILDKASPDLRDTLAHLG